MTDVQDLLESTKAAMERRAVPDFGDVVRRHRRSAHRRAAAGSAALVLVGAAGVGTYVAAPGGSAPAHRGGSAPVEPRLAPAASADDTRAQPPPALDDNSPCRGVEITQPTGPGGRDPVAASAQFAQDSGDGYPTDGWHVTYGSATVAQVESGVFTTLVVRGHDGVWQVRAAQRCD